MVEERNARKVFHAILKPLLPAAWTVLDHRPTPTTIAKTTVWISQESVQRDPTSPRGTDLTTLLVTVAVPIIDPRAAADLLEDELDLLLTALDKVRNITRGTADRGMTGGEPAYPGYDVEVITRTERKD